MTRPPTSNARTARTTTDDSSTVDVWFMRPETCSHSDLAELMAIFDSDEQHRCNAFAFHRNRIEYLAAHGLLRFALSRYRPVTPDAWRFHANRYGRPATLPACGLRFNISHHPTMVVCAIRDNAELEIGVDVESSDRGAEVLEVMNAVLAPSELRDLRALPEATQADRALMLWTLKESYIKARGLGLSLPLDDFWFSFESEYPTIGFGVQIDDVSARWHFRSIDLCNHRMALAVEVSDSTPLVRIHDVESISLMGLRTKTTIELMK